MGSQSWRTASAVGAAEAGSCTSTRRTTVTRVGSRGASRCKEGVQSSARYEEARTGAAASRLRTSGMGGGRTPSCVERGRRSRRGRRELRRLRVHAGRRCACPWMAKAASVPLAPGEKQRARIRRARKHTHTHTTRHLTTLHPTHCIVAAFALPRPSTVY